MVLIMRSYYDFKLSFKGGVIVEKIKVFIGIVGIQFFK